VTLSPRPPQQYSPCHDARAIRADVAAVPRFLAAQ